MRPRLARLRQHAPIAPRIPERYARTAPPRPAPLIALVTPSFEQARYLERTIRSVVSQRYPALDYVVQDGGSKDGTHEVLERHDASLTRWSSAPDGGQAEAINRGFAGVRGSIMAWLNADDLLLPGALAYVAAFFEARPDVDVVYGHRLIIDEQDREIGRWVLPPHDDVVLRWADFVPQETLFWRRSAWERTGAAIDESFRFAMDWELLLRFVEAHCRIVRLPRFLGAFRVHPGQKTSSEGDLGRQEMTRLRRRTLGRAPSAEQIHRGLGRFYAHHLALHALYRAGVLRY